MPIITTWLPDGSRIQQREQTFETFAASHQNRPALEAARRCALGESDRPLLIRGRVGVGKTHLLHAIALEAAKHQPRWRIAVLPFALLVYDLVRGVCNGRLPGLKRRLLRTQLLLLDDVEGMFRSQLRGVMTELLLYLVERRIRVVATTGLPTKTLPVELLGRGPDGPAWQTVPLRAPSAEARIAIVTAAAHQQGVQLPESAARSFARAAPGDVRPLLGLVRAAKLYADFTGRPIDVAVARRLSVNLSAPFRDFD